MLISLIAAILNTRALAAYALLSMFKDSMVVAWILAGQHLHVIFLLCVHTVLTRASAGLWATVLGIFVYTSIACILICKANPGKVGGSAAEDDDDDDEDEEAEN